MSTAPSIVALPGTLLDERSLAGCLTGCLAGTGAHGALLGEPADFAAELDRLAACLPGPHW